jgi:hypothetical protein
MRNSALGRYWRRGGSAIEHHAMKTCGELKIPLHTFYTTVLDRQDWLTSFFGLFAPEISF